ncbi:FixH family protein [Methylobacterium aquaticum]|jgi:nitrogen fixation protein FixH|uniref:FixH n=1 Tax=Methylobacterium aquaticum TaxID=270351 RepID=A0A0J6S9D5_9HYPH|nr:FixH family protein [Methylobacterium aquaticum]KMO30272.1 FixH [Methylobacterium aquaticum]
MSARPLAAAPPFRLTGRRVLLILVGFFGTIASADAVLVASALRTWSGLEVASPYHAGQVYNADLARARAQDARGWHLESAVARAGAGATLDVVVRERTGDPLAGKDLRARLERPTDARADRVLALAETAPGHYAGRIAMLPGGQWRLVVEVLGPDGVELRRERRLTLE